MSDFSKPAKQKEIVKTVEALEANNFNVELVETIAEILPAVEKLIPKGSEVFTVTSKTLDESGVYAAVNDTKDYIAIRPKMLKLAKDYPEKIIERKQLSATPEYVIGSAAALTEDGHILVASATGSQLGPEVYGATHVVFVISSKKIVKDIAHGIKRINEYVYPLEEQRIRQHYNDQKAVTYFSKLLIYMENYGKRVSVILVKEALGF